MNTKIRTIIITGLASLSFAGAAVAPAISQAQPPIGLDHVTFCAIAQTEYFNGMAEASTLRGLGALERANEVEGQAVQTLIAAVNEKCEWIARQAKAVTVVPSPIGRTALAQTTASPVASKPVVTNTVTLSKSVAGG